ncbi:hypothetical protein VTN77DRAFT_5049 [Rasamsonia byssochlamydoides]|uniref:uncharacterized protein n=1 Tax=Rasamsonia byssochlamydoides TaxID=89139 RepID=UPI0037422150
MQEITAATCSPSGQSSDHGRQPGEDVGRQSDIPNGQTASNRHRLSAILPVSSTVAAGACVCGGFLALFSSFGFLNAMGLFQTYYEETLLQTKSASAISWISTFQLFAMFAFGGIFGRIIDAYGAAVVMIPSAILCTLSIALLSLCRQYYQIFLAQGLGFGVGASGLFSCAVVATGQWFRARRALAMGIVVSGSSLGGVIHPIYLRILIQQIGFPGAVRYAALVIGVCTVLSCLSVSTRLPRKKWDHDTSFFDLRLFKDPAFVMYSLGGFLVFVLNAASIAGRILPAYAADRFGRFNIISIISAITAILLLAFWLPLELKSGSHTQILVFGALYGFASGAFISIMLPCVGELAPDVKKLGQTFGVFQVVAGIASLTGLPIQGALITGDSDKHPSYRDLIIFAGVSVAVGSVAIVSARSLHRRRKMIMPA